MNPELQAIVDQITELQNEAKAIVEKLEASPSAEEQSDLSTKAQEIGQRLEVLEADRRATEAEAERKAILEQLDSLEQRFEEGRKPHEGFTFGAGAPTPSGKAVYGEDGERSFYNDVRLATSSRGDSDAKAALEEAFEGKAMGEGTNVDGGFTVVPEVANELIAIRDHAGVLRNLFSSIDISTDTLEFIAQDSGLAVAWTAEFAEKIQTQFKFSKFEVHVFTAAGLAVASNQLLADSKWQIDSLINADLAKRFVSLDEQAWLAGDGKGEPLGILNTPGVGSVPFGTGLKLQDLLDAIADAITNIYTDFLAPPTAIVMHPRVWGKIGKARESTSPSTYLIGAGATAFGRRADEALPGYGAASLPRGELFGVPVYTSPNVPTDLGGGAESAVFVGDFSQGLVLDRQGITTDRSEHVYFTTNQTVFRSEKRGGFTAGRYPDAFQVVQGAGLSSAEHG